MKRIVMIFAAAAIGIGSTFAQIPDQRHPMQPRDNVVTDAESIETRVNFLSGKLDLTEQQSAKLKELFSRQRSERQKANEEYRAQIEKMRAEHRAAMKEMAQENREEMEKILTPEQAEALKAFQAKRQKHREAGPGHHRHHPAPHHACPCCFGHHFGPADCPADKPANHRHHHGPRHGCGR